MTGQHPTGMDFDILVERDESGAYIADVPLLPDCHSWGATHEDAVANVREAISLYLEVEGPPRSTLVSIERVNVEA